MVLYPDGEGMGAGTGAAGDQGATGQGDQGATGGQAGQPAAAPDYATWEQQRDAAWNAHLQSPNGRTAWLKNMFASPEGRAAVVEYAKAQGLTIAEAKAEIKAGQDAAKQGQTGDPEIDEIRQWYKNEKSRREAEKFDRDLQSEVQQAVGSHPLVKDPDLGPIVLDYVAGMRVLRPDLAPRQLYAMATQHLEARLQKYVARVGGRRAGAAAVVPIRGGGSPGGSKKPFDPSKVSFDQLAQQTAAQLDE